MDYLWTRLRDCLWEFCDVNRLDAAGAAAAGWFKLSDCPISDEHPSCLLDGLAWSIDGQEFDEQVNFPLLFARKTSFSDLLNCND